MAARFTLRPATAADLAAVDALLARSYPRLLAPDYPPSVLVLAVPLISRARPELLASGTYWLAQDAQGRAVGAGGWTRRAPQPTEEGHGGTTGHIRHFVTDADRVRQGIGRALMDQVLTQARLDGIRLLECLATHTAVPFYAAMGFQERGVVNVPLRPGIVFPAIGMRRSL